MANRINGNKALAEYVGVGMTTIYKLIKLGVFDKARVKRSPRLVAYITEEVDKAMVEMNKY